MEMFSTMSGMIRNQNGIHIDKDRVYPWNLSNPKNIDVNWKKNEKKAILIHVGKRIEIDL